MTRRTRRKACGLPSTHLAQTPKRSMGKPGRGSQRRVKTVPTLQHPPQPASDKATVAHPVPLLTSLKIVQNATPTAEANIPEVSRKFKIRSPRRRHDVTPICSLRSLSPCQCHYYPAMRLRKQKNRTTWTRLDSRQIYCPLSCFSRVPFTVSGGKEPRRSRTASGVRHATRLFSQRPLSLVRCPTTTRLDFLRVWVNRDSRRPILAWIATVARAAFRQTATCTPPGSGHHTPNPNLCIRVPSRPLTTRWRTDFLRRHYIHLGSYAYYTF